MMNVLRYFSRIFPIAILAACTGSASVDRADPSLANITELPPMKTFSLSSREQSIFSNRDLARDFLELSFQLESGATLPYFTRFEGPITLRVTGLSPPTLQPDLDRLLARLRREAGVSITQVKPEQPANITIDVITRRQLSGVVPHAACFVAPNVTNWQEYKTNRNRRLTDWRALKAREHVAIFMPGDVSPQDIRDCLHEEIAQSIGPLNDLFRLTDSIFNDDNFHTVLTASDMLMLRSYNSPRLRNGMSKNQVAALLPGILRNLNPEGERLPYRNVVASSDAWRALMAQALSPLTGKRKRQRAIDQAIAQAEGWHDNRLAFALTIKARLLAPSDPIKSYEHFLSAYRLFAVRPETRLHASHVATHLAVYALAAGEPEQALILINAHLKTVENAQNAALLATLLFAQSEAYLALGQVDRSDAIRQEAQAWARYGIGTDQNVRDHENEIAKIARQDECTSQPCAAGG